MDIDDLKIVAAVAKHGSMNRAAADLHMVQSSVTARIRLIEEELGVRLFVRHNRGVRLSDAGLRLLPYSDRIRSLVSEAITAVKEDGIPKGGLRIGSTEPTVSMRLPQVVAEYATEYPAVELTLTTGNTVDLIEQVLDESLDGAFVAAPMRHPELSAEPIFQEELVLVSHSSVLSMEALAKARDTKAIVLDQGCSYRDRLSHVLTARGIAHQILSFASFDAIRSCVQSGVGVTLLPRELFASTWRGESVIAHELPEFTNPIETIFIRRLDGRRMSALDAFLAKSRALSNLR
ncbi:LysR family transcriptional regulator [Acidicapsa ligni]|uniref:LysR family transcriptional regulator n=1 Tax=Acidicapsa ligni TaxID=542300 RepID=UPI0021DFC734|nr:LysR family transcriptional regulator [Acidicapsa ligni]